jgi:hypothetical protein
LNASFQIMAGDLGLTQEGSDVHVSPVAGRVRRAATKKPGSVMAQYEFPPLIWSKANVRSVSVAL